MIQDGLQELLMIAKRDRIGIQEILLTPESWDRLRNELLQIQCFGVNGAATEDSVRDIEYFTVRFPRPTRK